MTVQKDIIHRLLLFSLGDGLYGAQVSYIREIVPDQEKNPLPGAPDFIPGIINIRSDVVKIIDIRRIIPLGEEQAKKKIIVFIPEDAQSTRFGILVDEVHGIMDIPEKAVSYLDRSDTKIQNNFMLGFMKISLDTFLNQRGREFASGDDDLVWIDFEDLINTIIDGDQADSIVFRLTALFNPQYLLSGEWKKSAGK
ncbi:MAG TPA: chemotaxis protein CheW [Methanospirillum sp.]|jgi:purine-binding chemotaxis protein CheW|uniref:chemotaxis protein CheW n=1 Tax=Methanospirillum sp. TaxID=45200 RepID=UPI0009D110DD|nr:chemotaxis protein CheW [Methanospirillum sp.]OQB36719.1 MAG: purine-binding chemotaxis protein [Euryarchaeota archaeon ADurb.Bin165]HPY60933.1 chemotaxis protein CheW [Methanospirillum sp.]HQB99073.1 chemotaxis protein CheW [Methanospirillum sp.]